jgi:thiol peroxidase
MTKVQTAVTLKGNPVTLLGNEVNVGDEAPNFVAVANDLSKVKFSSFRGQVVLIASVPSLDTSICDVETRRFNVEAGKLGSDVVVLVISMDLPFAQKRWCGASGVENVQTLSDYRDAAFGMGYGVLIEDLRLLGRAIFIVDREGRVRYKQLVEEIASEPDYEAALSVLRQLVNS